MAILKEEKKGDGHWFRRDCLMLSPYSFFITYPQPHHLPHCLPLMQVSYESVMGGKRDRKRNLVGERRKIEHPSLLPITLFSQALQLVLPAAQCAKKPFHLAWLCKRFSQWPKGCGWNAPDKVPSLPDGLDQRERKSRPSVKSPLSVCVCES